MVIEPKWCNWSNYAYNLSSFSVNAHKNLLFMQLARYYMHSTYYMEGNKRTKSHRIPHVSQKHIAPWRIKRRKMAQILKHDWRSRIYAKPWNFPIEWRINKEPQTLDLGGTIASPKTYESNFIHHDFVKFGKQHSRYKAKGVRKGGWGLPLCVKMKFVVGNVSLSLSWSCFMWAGTTVYGKSI